MKGSCLCQTVCFELTAPIPDFYQCHCSLCRKLSGSASDTATFIAKEQFQWSQGKDAINSFKTTSGYRSDFCANCGSTVPHLMQNGKQYWVPAGLLEEDCNSLIVAQLYINSKAQWDVINPNGSHFTEMPSMSELNELIHNRCRSS